MFINVDILEFDENMNLIRLSLQCKKISNLVIDCHSSAYAKPKVRKNLDILFEKNFLGRIVIILHEKQNFQFGNEIQLIKFFASDLTENFKSSLKVNFQGSKLLLSDLFDIKIIKELRSFLEGNIFENVTTCDNDAVISIGNQISFDIPRSKEANFQNEIAGVYKYFKLNDEDEISKLFEKYSCLMIECKPGDKTYLRSLIMCRKLKSFYPMYWIIHINISEFHFPMFDSTKNYSDQMEYFSEEYLKLKFREREIFLNFLTIGRIIFVIYMNDTIDEVVDFSYKENVKKLEILVNTLKSTNRVCVFISSQSLECFKDLQYCKIKVPDDE